MRINCTTEAQGAPRYRIDLPMHRGCQDVSCGAVCVNCTTETQRSPRYKKTASVFSVPRWCGLTHNGRAMRMLWSRSFLLCALCVSVVLFCISVLSVSLWCGSYTTVAPAQSFFASFLSLCSLCLCGVVHTQRSRRLSILLRLFAISVLSVSLWCGKYTTVVPCACCGQDLSCSVFSVSLWFYSVSRCSLCLCGSILYLSALCVSVVNTTQDIFLRTPLRRSTEERYVHRVYGQHSGVFGLGGHRHLAAMYHNNSQLLIHGKLDIHAKMTVYHNYKKDFQMKTGIVIITVQL